MKKVQGCAIQIIDFVGDDSFSYKTDEELSKTEAFNCNAFNYLIIRNIFLNTITIKCWQTYLTKYFQNEKAYGHLEFILFDVICMENLSGYSFCFLELAKFLIHIICDRIDKAESKYNVDCDLWLIPMAYRCPRLRTIMINLIFNKGIYIHDITCDRFIFGKETFFYKNKEVYNKWKLILFEKSDEDDENTK